jgi:hypothetical protein
VYDRSLEMDAHGLRPSNLKAMEIEWFKKHDKPFR